MKILLLSFYYPPDLCAGSFRAKALETALHDVASRDLHIDILTTAPNRYSTLLREAADVQESEGLTVRRFPLPSHKSGMVDQSKAFIAFGRAVLKETRGKKWDLVVATSSRLMTAALGAYVAKRSKTPLYLDIRDLFTDTMSDLLPKSLSRVVLPAFRQLEKWTLRSASRVNLVSAGFIPHANAIAPKHDYRLFTNGIDEGFLTMDFAGAARARGQLPLVVYAGNMGEGQGLSSIVPMAAKAFEGKARFRFVGDGGRRPHLEAALKEADITNVELINPVPREELYVHYRDADILFLHLNDHAAFRKVLPSKIFEYAATGKPMLAGVAGFAAEFLASEVKGVAVFPPCDVPGMVESLDRLLSGPAEIQRDVFKTQYTRKKIMQDMAEDIISTGEES